MQLIDIEQQNVGQILTRNSITIPNFLSENKYYTKSNIKVVENSQYISWIKEECLNLNIMSLKIGQLEQKKKKNEKLYRSEIRYVQKQLQKDIDIEYTEKYKEYKVGCILQNSRVDQIDISQQYIICLTKHGQLSIINMQLSKSIQVQSHKKNNFFQIILSDNQNDCFYAIDTAYYLHQITFSDGRVNKIFNIQNYPLFIGNHQSQKIRLIQLNSQCYLLYSEQCFLFYFQVLQNNSNNKLVQNAMIKKSHYIPDIHYNLIISEFNESIFVINNVDTGKEYLIFTRETNIQEGNSCIFNSFQINGDRKDNQINRLNQGLQNVENTIETFLSRFDSKKEVFRIIKKVWCLKLCKLLNNEKNTDNYFYYFKDYIITEIEQFLLQEQISFQQLLHLTIILLAQFKQKYLITLLQQLETIIEQEKFKKIIWSKIWEYMPLYDVEREQSESDYKPLYINISKILGTEQEISFLLHDN